MNKGRRWADLIVIGAGVLAGFVVPSTGVAALAENVVFASTNAQIGLGNSAIFDTDDIEAPDGSVTAISDLLVGSDIASATGDAILGGAVKSRSEAGGAGGTMGPMFSSAVAGWSAVYQANGRGQIDLDVNVNLDGFLSVLNNNSGDSVYSSVSLDIVIDTQTTTDIEVFGGFAELKIDSALNRQFTQEGDFTGTGTLANSSCVVSCRAGYDISVSLDDVLAFAPNEQFSLFVFLATDADTPGGFESIAEAIFDDTLVLELSSSNGGSFSLIDTAPVPLPPMLIPFLMALGGISLRRK